MSIQIKKAIAKLNSYRPEVKTSAKGQKQIRLSVNEGALGASPKAQAALLALGPNLHRYPEQINQDLVSGIAQTYKLDPKLILPSNGSDELIGLLATAFLEEGDEAIYTQYGFLVFPQAIRIAGGVPVVAQDNHLTVSVDSILQAITPKTKLIFIANPNNPTGTMISTSEIERLISSIPSSVVLVLDSAYAEYVPASCADYTDGATYVEKHDNVVMLRTFSKIFGLASLRLGWGYFPPAIMETLASIRPPFSVNTAAAHAGLAAVLDHEFLKKSQTHNQKYMAYMQEKVQLAGLESLPSCTNFFLIRFANADEAEAAHAFLGTRGIQLRRMVPYGLEGCLRMSIGTAEEMAITATAIKDYVDNHRGRNSYANL